MTAPGTVNGEARRAVSAPFDGYLQTQFARAGDVVRAGAVLAELQDNDLVLNRLRKLAARRQTEAERDQALAKRDLAQAAIAKAALEQKDAEIALDEEMLERARIRAPFDAVVVSGDLAQSIGKPVSRGDVLYELAPLDRYRVTLNVPETAIGSIRAGQKGQLLLTALPERPFAVEVIAVTPVARVADGVNSFEVLAHLADADERVRPPWRERRRSRRASLAPVDMDPQLLRLAAHPRLVVAAHDDALRRPLPMSGSLTLYSALWHRVENLRPKMKPGVAVERHVIRGEIWYVIPRPSLRREPTAFPRLSMPF